MSSQKQFLRYWAVIGGYIGFLFLLILVQGVLDATNLLSLRASLIPFLLLHVILMVAFFVIATRMFRPRVYEEAHRNGQPATGQVLAVKKTGWRNRMRKQSSFVVKIPPPGRSRIPFKYEYELQLRITPVDAPAYEAKVTTFLETAEVPTPGTMVAVKIHPQRSDIVILSTDE